MDGDEMMRSDITYRAYLFARAEEKSELAVELAGSLLRQLAEDGQEPACWANPYLGDRRRARFYSFCSDNGVVAARTNPRPAAGRV